MTKPSSAAVPTLHRIGDTTVQKIWELDLNGMTFGQLFPGLDDAAQRDHPDWLAQSSSSCEQHVSLSVHAWLVRHQGQNILIDTGAGNHKSRPQQKALNELRTPFLSRLRAAGVEPENVDVVLHTHIHADHVGWDTSLSPDCWRPTFARAQVILSELEYAYGGALAQGDLDGVRAARGRAGLGEPARVPNPGTFADSIAPLVERNLVRPTLTNGTEVLPGIRFISTPGHSIDHASIELVSRGETALFSGDVFHHPLEVRETNVVSTFCEFPPATRQSRRRFLDYAAETSATVFTSHFIGSSAGKVMRTQTGYDWEFTEPSS